MQLPILNAIEDDETSNPKLNVSLKIGSYPILFELDTATQLIWVIFTQKLELTRGYTQNQSLGSITQ